MKLVKEYINEKFTDESDPIRDMGIGIYVKRNFNSINEAVNFIISVMPAILSKKTIPYGIIHGPNANNLFPWKYYNVIAKYVEEYMNIKNYHNSPYVMSHLFDTLTNMGYPKHKPKKQNTVNEKFKDESDPIDDLNIGIRGDAYICGRCGSLTDADGEEIYGEEFEKAKIIYDKFENDSKRVHTIECMTCIREEQYDREREEQYEYEQREREREQEEQEERERWQEERRDREQQEEREREQNQPYPY